MTPTTGKMTRTSIGFDDRWYQARGGTALRELSGLVVPPAQDRSVLPSSAVELHVPGSQFQDALQAGNHDGRARRKQVDAVAEGPAGLISPAGDGPIATQGAAVEIICEGTDEEAALQALCQLIESKFDEE